MKHKHKPIFRRVPMGSALTQLAKAVQFTLLGLSMAHQASHAATIEVTTNLDGGVGCTLREALTAFNEFDIGEDRRCVTIGAEPFGTNDRIIFSDSFSANRTILLNQDAFRGALYSASLAKSNGVFLTIDASNIDRGIIVDADRQSRVLSVESANLRIINMTFTGGETAIRVFGGGIRISNSNVELHEVTVTGNVETSSEGSRGGGLYITSSSTVSLINSTVSKNTSSITGGGIALRGSSLNLIGSTITENSADATGGGLAVITGRSNSASVNLTDSTVSSNSANRGGGISASTYFPNGSVGALTFNVNSSNISNNTATRYGGGLYIDDGQHTIKLENSMLSQNVALEDGGAIAMIQNGGRALAESSYLELVKSTVANNTASVDAGGIMVSRSTFKSSNSTISGNTAFDDAGGILATLGADVILDSVTIANNMAARRGVGIGSFGGAEVSITNSILAASNGLDCFVEARSSVNVDDATIIEDGSCLATRFGDPGLLPLADNGGPTLTHALSEDSIARNSSIGTCLPFDQRGKRRDFSDGACDVGAFEFVIEDDTTFFVIPLKSGNAVIFDL